MIPSNPIDASELVYSRLMKQDASLSSKKNPGSELETMRVDTTHWDWV